MHFPPFNTQFVKVSVGDTLDKKVSSEVIYDWDYLDRMEERGEMPLEELMSLYKNLYT